MFEFIGYENLWKAVIRPKRQQYTLADLGPEEFVLNNMKMQRTDIQLKNHQGFNLQCSHFEPQGDDRQWNELPCVIYLHGNQSSRLESLEAAKILLPLNITLFTFDFAGCGMSEGEFVSLGWYEREDLAIIVDYLRKERNVSTIGLWGRSMGAVTALLYGDSDPSIGGMVLDSPFSNLHDLVKELSRVYTKIPSLLINGAIKFISQTIKKQAKFDIYQLNPIDHVDKCYIPALFATADKDNFVQPHHSQKLFDKYAGDKNLIKFDGDHFSSRPKFLYDSASIFFFNTLQVETLLTEETKTNTLMKSNILQHQLDYEVLSEIIALDHFKSTKSVSMSSNYGGQHGENHQENEKDDNEDTKSDIQSEEAKSDSSELFNVSDFQKDQDDEDYDDLGDKQEEFKESEIQNHGQQEQI